MGLTAEKLKEVKDQGDIQVINDAYTDRAYQPFAMLIRVRQKTAYQKENSEGGPMTSIQMFCSKVLDHSYNIENEILLSRLRAYKNIMAYRDISYDERAALKKSKRPQKTPSQEA